MTDNRTAYWDSVLVVDNAVPEELFKKVKAEVRQSTDLSEGKVVGTDPKDTAYLAWEPEGQEVFVELKEWLQASDLLPVLPDMKTHMVARHHQMQVDGKMAWHCDGDYSLAVSIYLTGCAGGELQVSSTCGTQSVSISALENRLVVLKCNQMHRVLPVIDGTRDSIQIFVTYFSEE